MNDRRRDLLSQLEAAAEKTPRVPDELLSLCFQIMYGLPTELQLRAAIHMCERYLPIYETRLPASTWPRKLLGDIDTWSRENHEATPEGPDDIDSSDLSYESGFVDLLFGYRFRDDPACLTASICVTIIHVVGARADNVFAADDPLASRLWKEERAWCSTWESTEEENRPPEPESFRQLWQPEHNPGKNVAFIAVYRREWLHVVEWLRTEAVWKYPEPDDMDAMMRSLKVWEDREFIPLGPKAADEPT